MSIDQRSHCFRTQRGLHKAATLLCRGQNKCRMHKLEGSQSEIEQNQFNELRLQVSSGGYDNLCATLKNDAVSLRGTKRNEIRLRSKCPGQNIEAELVCLKKKVLGPAPQHSPVSMRFTHGLNGFISEKATTFKVHY